MCVGNRPTLTSNMIGSDPNANAARPSHSAAPKAESAYYREFVQLERLYGVGRFAETAELTLGTQLERRPFEIELARRPR